MRRLVSDRPGQRLMIRYMKSWRMDGAVVVAINGSYVAMATASWRACVPLQPCCCCQRVPTRANACWHALPVLMVYQTARLPRKRVLICLRKGQLLLSATPYYPFPREISLLGIIWVLLWADMNAATLPGSRGRTALCAVCSCAIICRGRVTTHRASPNPNMNFHSATAIPVAWTFPTQHANTRLRAAHLQSCACSGCGVTACLGDL